MITSTGNAQMKHAAQLLKKHSLRQKEKLFVVEGWKMAEEIPQKQMVKLYLSEEAEANPKAARLKKLYPYETVSAEVMQKISDTVTSQGVLAIVRQQETSLHTIMQPDADLFLLLDCIQDPGNLGTMLRMAEAAGIKGVILSRDTVDIYNPKVVRATMGAIYRVPFCFAEDLAACIGILKKAGVSVYGASLERSADYASLDYRGKCAFVIGNEANGLSQAVLQAVTQTVHIPMAGQVESLNAAIAASVLTFEAVRQKRTGCANGFRSKNGA